MKLAPDRSNIGSEFVLADGNAGPHKVTHKLIPAISINSTPQFVFFSPDLNPIGLVMGSISNKDSRM